MGGYGIWCILRGLLRPPKRGHVAKLMEQDLRTSVVRAEDAVRCCDSGFVRAISGTLGLMSDLIRGLIDDPPSEPASAGMYLVLASRAAALEVGELSAGEIAAIEAAKSNAARAALFRGTAARAGLLGGTLLIAGIKAVDIAGQTATLETLTMVSNMISQLQGQKLGERGNCAECVRRKLLPQTSQRTEQTGTFRRRQN